MLFHSKQEGFVVLGPSLVVEANLPLQLRLIRGSTLDQCYKTFYDRT
jgi:hypothetical protein